MGNTARKRRPQWLEDVIDVLWAIWDPLYDPYQKKYTVFEMDPKPKPKWWQFWK